MLSEPQLAALTVVFRAGAADATIALSRWLGKPAQISVERVEQLPLHDATEVLGEADAPLAACVMVIHGRVTGQLIMAFDDRSGLCLADLLLARPTGTSTSWTALERSAAEETANIVGCAYLNALSRHFQGAAEGDEVLPTPPKLTHDFAQSLIQFAVMNQAAASDMVFLTRTQFSIDGSPVHWSLLFVPDAECLPTLESILAV
jgi:chemotaxis protein CheC